jgi:hypothetical protein
MPVDRAQLDCVRTRRLAANLYRAVRTTLALRGTATGLPNSSGTESSQTLRWREMDSNFRYRGTKAVDFRSIPGMAEDQRGS